MANEIKVSAMLQSTKGGINVVGNSSYQRTQSGNHSINNRQTIATSTTAISIGGIATMGEVWIRNLDPTNFIYVSLITPAIAATAFGKLKPGRMLLLPTHQTVIYAIADTAACDVNVVAAED